jgi:hypothetical protein
VDQSQRHASAPPVNKANTAVQAALAGPANQPIRSAQAPSAATAATSPEHFAPLAPSGPTPPAAQHLTALSSVSTSEDAGPSERPRFSGPPADVEMAPPAVPPAVSTALSDPIPGPTATHAAAPAQAPSAPEAPEAAIQAHEDSTEPIAAGEEDEDDDEPMDPAEVDAAALAQIFQEQPGSPSRHLCNLCQCDLQSFPALVTHADRGNSLRFTRGHTKEDAVPFVNADTATLVEHASSKHPSVWAKLREQYTS